MAASCAPTAHCLLDQTHNQSSCFAPAHVIGECPLAQRVAGQLPDLWDDTFEFIRAPAAGSTFEGRNLAANKCPPQRDVQRGIANAVVVAVEKRQCLLPMWDHLSSRSINSRRGRLPRRNKSKTPALQLWVRCHFHIAPAPVPNPDSQPSPTDLRYFTG